MDFISGRIVKSKAGHDKECFYIIVDVQDPYCYISDGKHHKLNSPKKKNIKHIVGTSTVVDLPQTDKQLRKLLNSFSTD